VYPKGFRDGSAVVDKYAPETVTNLEELYEQSEAYCCREELEKAVSEVDKLIFEASSKANLPLFIVIAIKRPAVLIGKDSDIELVAYVLDVGSNRELEPADRAVRPVSLREAVAPRLLRRVSGITEDVENRYSLIGFGSVGSKIGVHLSRAGFAPRVVVDDKFLRAHNLARHGLLRFQLFTPKAEAAAKIASGLSQNTKPYSVNCLPILDGGKELPDLANDRTLGVINSTASLAVREAYSAATTNVRGLETCLYADGKIAMLAVEGPNRNPCASDLVQELYFMAANNGELRGILFSDKSSLGQVEIGMGCSSVTMTVDDTEISAPTAAIAGQLLKWQEAGELPDEAQLLVGKRGDNGMDWVWHRNSVAPYMVVESSDGSGWTARVSSRVIDKMNDEIANHTSVETGGLLLGSVSESRKVITVVDVLPAPPDSVRKSAFFSLGTKGLAGALSEVMARSGDTIYCLGTWHSHLSDSGPSETDYGTAKKIADRTPIPQLMLIKTPKRMHCVAITQKAVE
jgi:hypothetical protein